MSDSHKSMQPRFLEFVNWETGEVVTRVDVTGESDSQIERCLRGMLINIGEKWFVRDTTDQEFETKKAPRRKAEAHGLEFI